MGAGWRAVAGAAMLLAACTPPVARPVAKLPPQPAFTPASTVTLGFSRIPMPPGEWRPIGENTMGGVINPMEPGMVSDGGLRIRFFARVNAGGQADALLGLASNTRRSTEFYPSQRCVLDQKDQTIYYKDVAASAAGNGDCLEVMRSPSPFRRAGSGSRSLDSQGFAALQALGGVPPMALETVINIARNRATVVVMIYDFPERQGTTGKAWDSAALGAEERAAIVRAAELAERLRPAIHAGVGMID